MISLMMLMLVTDVAGIPFITIKTKLSLRIYGIKVDDGEYDNNDRTGKCTHNEVEKN